MRKDRESAIEAHKRDMQIIETGNGMTYTIEIKEDGFVTSIVGLFNNITEYELLKKKLREQAITDELTGLYNRAYLDEFIRTHSDYYYPISIISADCDGLKEINATYGHTAGDHFLRWGRKIAKFRP